MYKRDQVLAKLDEFLTYSIEQSPEFEAEYTSLIPKGAVNSYFGTDRSAFKKPLEDLSLYLHNELWQRGAKYKESLELGLGANPSNSYNDLTKLFYSFDWLMAVTPENFYNAWIMGVPETSEGTVTQIPISNSYATRLVSGLLTAIEEELKAISSLGDWLGDSLCQSGSVMLWEETTLISAPTTQSLADEIFIKRKLLEAIKVLGLPVYIPTYLRGETNV